MTRTDARVAYFSMEIGIEPGLPTYSGGLGVLAGDTVKGAADLGVGLVAVTLLYRKGYFHQTLDAHGWQHEDPVAWVVEDFVRELPARVAVQIHGRRVALRAYLREVLGARGHLVPVLFLDSDLPENDPQDRGLTHHLYGGDSDYRLAQEVILGIGGVMMLRELGFDRIARYHMNEGHASLLAALLLSDELAATGKTTADDDAIDAVRAKCVFTTHTPVAAGHDRFHVDQVRHVLGSHEALERCGMFFSDGWLNMTHLGANLSGFVNAVSRKHAEVTRDMLGTQEIASITNGVHTATWTSAPFQALFDQHLPGWREDPAELRNALALSISDVLDAHLQAKRMLVHAVNRRTNSGMETDAFTIAYARRATGYKRPTLLFSDLDRLRQIVGEVGPIQVLFAGKAHPRDHHGKELIQQVHRAMDALRDRIRVAFMPNYDMGLAGLMVAGCDLWLNNPEPPLEASGTSGMKAAINGVPSLSTLDGWWLEGCIEGVTGWSIGERDPAGPRPPDAASMYDKLHRIIMPMYYRDRQAFADIMRHAIAINGPYFSAHRMVRRYLLEAYGAGCELRTAARV